MDCAPPCEGTIVTSSPSSLKKPSASAAYHGACLPCGLMSREKTILVSGLSSACAGREQKAAAAMASPRPLSMRALFTTAILHQAIFQKLPDIVERVKIPQCEPVWSGVANSTILSHSRLWVWESTGDCDRTALSKILEHGLERADHVQHLRGGDWKGSLSLRRIGKGLQQHA